MQTIFTVLRYLTIKQKPELIINGMVTPTIMDFRIWYDNILGMTERGNSFLKSIISSYEFHFFFRNMILKLEKLRQPVTNYIETTTFCKSSPPLQSMLMGLQIPPRPCCGQITDPQRERGVLMELSLKFLRENLMNCVL